MMMIQTTCTLSLVAILSIRTPGLHAFLLSPVSNRNALALRKVSSLEVKRSICTFDDDDFALATGVWPYTDRDLGRLDNSEDTAFYSTPRFVTHIDDRAIESLKSFYREELADVAKRKGDDIDVMDLCSSWISHLPDGVPFGRVVGVGMNEKELAANEQLTEYNVQDLNKNPSLSQFEDSSFDVICNVVSVDYLTKPREIFQEMHRILRPNGVALMSFSNRCFPSKAVAMWLQADDIGRMTIVASYFHYSAKWDSIEALDIIPAKMETPERPSVGDMFSDPSKGWAWMSTASAVQKANSGDPMYVVRAEK